MYVIKLVKPKLHWNDLYKAMLTFILGLLLRKPQSVICSDWKSLWANVILCLLLDLRIRRQHSSESVSSINSATSHSSIGSGNDADSKKKKKKNWVSHRHSSNTEAYYGAVSQTVFPWGCRELLLFTKSLSQVIGTSHTALIAKIRVAWCWRAYVLELDLSLGLKPSSATYYLDLRQASSPLGGA